MFKNAIVKKPSKMIINGLSSGYSGLPDPDLALRQHKEYVALLEYCGIKVTCLEEDEAFPDSVFVEDTAVIAGSVAVISNPGAPSRKGEIKDMESVLAGYFDRLDYIKYPGTLDGGDVMLAGKTFYIGLSGRTNLTGIEQFSDIVNGEGFECITVPLKSMLHLKTGVSYIGNNTIIVVGELLDEPSFKGFKKIIPTKDEVYAANSIRINDYVIIPAGFKHIKIQLEDAGYKVLEADVSEFRKIDGGLSCLSVRF